jgi:hypothetical protein
MPVRVTRKDGDYQVVGMAWGAPIAKVEVQIDSSPWLEATIDRSEEAEFAWKPWSVLLGNVTAGTHSVTSRATDNRGNVQPAMDDPRISRKKTYWESNGQVSRKIQLG